MWLVESADATHLSGPAQLKTLCSRVSCICVLPSFPLKHGCRTVEPFEPCRGRSTKRAMTQTRGLRAND